VCEIDRTVARRDIDVWVRDNLLAVARWWRGGGCDVVALDSPVSGATPTGLERWTIGDRLAAFGVLLPADPVGPVVLAVGDKLAAALQYRFPAAVVLDERGADLDHPTVPRRVVQWDGCHSPLRAASVGLLVVDTRLVSVDALREAVAADGTLAALGRRGRYVLYPNSEHPEQIWRRGWPIPAMRGCVPQLRRTAGLWASAHRSVPRLALSGASPPSVVDLVLADLTAATGVRGRLVGVHTAGRTILRVRGPAGDLAVRLSFSDPNRVVDAESPVLSDVPAVGRLLPGEIARGMTAGCPWVANRWVPRRARIVVKPWRSERRRLSVAAELAAELQTVSTGTTRSGWAREWCDGVALLPSAVRARLIPVLEPLEHGLPTAWCHGDLWPGNVLLDGPQAAVIDWDNATSDAPQGLDWLLLAALKAMATEPLTAATACVRMVDGSIGIEQPIGGRRWADWDREHRLALVVAAFLLYLRNRSLHDLGPAKLRENLDTVLAAVDGANIGTDADPDGPPGSNAGRAARGALWLGTSSVVVKGVQTVVLLILAAVLAPSALGLIAIGTLVVNFSSTITDLGTSSALVYWRGDVRRAARSAMTVALGVGVLMTAAAWALAPWLSRTLHADDGGADVIRGLTSVLPCYAVASVTFELLRRELAFVRRIIPDVVAATVGAAIAVVLALGGHGVAALVIGQIVQGVLSMLLVWVVGQRVRPGWNRADVRGLLGYGGHLAGANTLQLILLNVDYLIVARVLGATALGQYSLAFRLAYLPYLNVAFVISGAAYPYLCRLSGPALGRATERVTAAAITVLVPLCLAMALFANQLTFLGEKWSPAVPAVRWLALYGLLLSIGQLAQTPLNAVGRPRASMQLRLLHLIALVVALLLLAPHGITAIAIGQVLAVIVAAIASVALARRHLPGLSLQRLTRTLVPAATAGVAMAAIVLAAQRVFPAAASSVTGFVALAVVGFAAYAALVCSLDRATVVRMAQMIRTRV
jgi:O-antigen/teichoic acid export membrane protein